MSQRVARRRAPRVATDRGHRRGRELRRARRPTDRRASTRCAATSRASARSPASPPNGSRATARSAASWSRAPSEILDLGRRTRTDPPPLRRPIRLRDQHCQYPGCRAPGRVVRRAPSGPLAARRRDRTSRTARCCAGVITSPATRAVGSWCADRPALRSRRERRPPRCRRVLGVARRHAGGPARRSGVRRAVRRVHRVLHVVAVRAHRTRRDRHARAHPRRAALPRARAPVGSRACSGTTSTAAARCWATTGARSTSTDPARAAPTTAGCSPPPASSPTRANRPSPPRSAGGASTSSRPSRPIAPVRRRRRRAGNALARALSSLRRIGTGST